MVHWNLFIGTCSLELGGFLGLCGFRDLHHAQRWMECLGLLIDTKISIAIVKFWLLNALLYAKILYKMLGLHFLHALARLIEVTAACF